jgi:hypothetical protein
MVNWYFVRLCMVLAIVLAAVLLIALCKMVKATVDKLKTKLKESVQ